ncbi:MAG: M13 family metallopeptidase [Kofleriaceae bacterium]
MKLPLSIVLAGLAAACSGKAKPAEPMTPSGPGPAVASAPAPTPPPPAPPGPPVQKMSLAEVGLEPASLDRSFDPCVDFYQFACGGWLKKTEIPADKARWGRFSEIDERNKSAIKQLLEDDLKGGDASAKKLGDYYASCMDEAAIEKAGTKGIQPLLDKAMKVRDNASWFTALVELHKAGIDVVFGQGAQPDLKNSIEGVTGLDSGGLGLPDRDYYLQDKFKSKVDAYTAHVGRMLALVKQPVAAAADVVAIETDLAKVTKTGVEKRDVPASYNPTDLKGLAKQTKSFDWPAYFRRIGVKPSAKIIEGTPKYFDALDGLRAKYKPAQWAHYFTYHLLEQAAPTLPKAFDEEAFELEKALTGVEKQEDRYKRCINATTGALGELLGKQYADKYFPAAAKQTAVTNFEAILAALHDDLGQLDWMSDATRQLALAKLAKVVKMIGYPDKWRVYDFAVKRGDFAGNAVRANTYEAHRQANKAGKPWDRGEWEMNSFTVNAYYEPSANNTALPAGILQPPFFGADRSVAANMGGIGMVIGHELTHGFDDQGAQFDADGNLKNWWTDADKQQFDAKGTCVADQYSSFEAMPKGFVNGRLTLGENIADLGGVKMAFRAYRALRKGADKQLVADGFTEDQQFFLAVGQAWCSKDRPAEIQRRLTVDPHSPPKFRVYGALRNLPEFAAAFSCPAGTPMHPVKACSVW